ncbi:thioesterase [Prauserella halophila]|uniref:Thioesterase n=1 Tax=Prauserella halophila TaxID=185641 RepID=A0ABN1VWV5_9PSEU|nr:alpha/beta hydrolase [Prauserella halophila]MCP2234282.1 Alpha/beta hydrolase family protein [Prauserella halophila]
MPATPPAYPASPAHAAVLPGTGSDEVFARAVFAPALRAADIVVHTPRPHSGGALVREALTALDAAAAAAPGPILVGGVSLGAQLAVEWALRNGPRCAGVLAVLPAWSGTPGDAPAAVAARASADLIDREGLEQALALSTDDVPPWLAAELTRSWRRHGDGLAAGLRTAAAHPAPDDDALARCPVPVGISACTDDPVHPAGIARAWAGTIPRARLRELPLAAFGADPASAGRAAVEAWSDARRDR